MEERRDDRSNIRGDDRNRDLNRDPITKEPGSHPLGTGVGSAGGAAVGAAVGAPFGPIGFLVGGAIGAVAGGAAGHAAGEAIDPTVEDAYWSENYRNRPYVTSGSGYEEYRPAYRYGWESRTRHRGRTWDHNLERDLEKDWSKNRGNSRLEWNEARHATRDAWDRADRTYRTYENTDRHWSEAHPTSSWADRNYDYESDYRPAYRYGTYARTRYGDRAWDDNLENDLGRDWDRHKGNSRLSWENAKSAVRAGWHKVEDKLPGDADNDGR